MLHLLPKIFAAIGALLGAMSCYYTVYAIVGLFATRRFAPARRQHRYAIVIAARNEEAVIGRLLESIRLQDYPSELLTVFVVADNCTDGTAQAARSGGAVCYERCDPDHRTKGYAGAPVHDAVAVCALLRPDLLHFEDWHVTVETQGAFCRGATVGDRRTAPNARVITGIDREGFAELLTEAVRTYG